MPKLIFIFFLLPVSAFAGVKVIGTGGKGVFCPGTAPKVLDLVEGEGIHSLPPDTAGLSGDGFSQATQVFQRLEKVFPSFVKFSLRRLEEIQKSVQWRDSLPDINDTAHWWIPAGCELRQLAFFRWEEIESHARTPQREYFINQNYWNLLSAHQQAALLVHEVLYSIGVDHFYAWDLVRLSNEDSIYRALPENSYNVRWMVARLFAETKPNLLSSIIAFTRSGVNVWPITELKDEQWKTKWITTDTLSFDIYGRLQGYASEDIFKFALLRDEKGFFFQPLYALTQKDLTENKSLLLFSVRYSGGLSETLERIKKLITPSRRQGQIVYRLPSHFLTKLSPYLNRGNHE